MADKTTKKKKRPRREEEDLLEAFTPEENYDGLEDDLFDEPPRRKKGSGVLIGVLCAVIGVLGIALGTGLYYYNRMVNDPASFFKTAGGPTPVIMAAEEGDALLDEDGEPDETADTEELTLEATPEPARETPAPTPTPEPTPTPSPTPEPSEYDKLAAGADQNILQQDILNVCLIGVDYAEERESGYGGKAEDNAFHADVIMVLAINFTKNRVDMISIPRDTYANIPGVKGIYKINASLDCGGGLKDPEHGFEKVCDAAEWMLGGLPVDYYYAVTMPAVKGLVNAVGGVDYDLELAYKMQGRSYTKGMQHLDGQGVLDYLRVRKNIAASGDNNRVNRQKDMLVALFKSMQQQNLILKIPDILSAFEGGLYTNTTPAQTAALALFAYNLDSSNISMHSMGSGSNGSGGNTNIFNWNFCLTNQEHRVELIKEIYDIDVPVYREYTSTYAHYRWYSMLESRYYSTARTLEKYIDKQLGNDTADDDDGGSSGSSGSSSSGGDIGGDFGFDDGVVAPPLAVGGSRVTNAKYSKEDREYYARFCSAVKNMHALAEECDAQAKKYRNGKSNSLNSHNSEMKDALDEVQSMATSLAKTFGYTKSLNWTVRYEYDSDFNEVRVNFN